MTNYNILHHHCFEIKFLFLTNCLILQAYCILNKTEMAMANNVSAGLPLNEDVKESVLNSSKKLTITEEIQQVKLQTAMAS